MEKLKIPQPLNRSLFFNPKSVKPFFGLLPHIIRGESSLFFRQFESRTSIVARNKAQWALSNHFRRNFYKAAEEGLKRGTLIKGNKLIETFFGLSAVGFGFYLLSNFSVAEGLSTPGIFTDSARIRRRLQQHKMRIQKIIGDGNCQFRAIADQLLDDQNQHKLVRQRIISWLLQNGDLVIDGEGTRLKDFQIDYPSWATYCKHMSKEGAWGDHFTLIGAAEVFKINIWILTSVDCPDDQAVTTIAPKNFKGFKDNYDTPRFSKPL